MALSALLGVMSSSAFAADIVPAAPTWTGFYLGAGGGGSFAFADIEGGAYYDDYDQLFSLGGGSASDLGKAGVFGTIEAGADYQMDNFLFGAVADFNFGKNTMDNSTGFGGETPDGYVDGWVDQSVEVGNSWDIGARVGMLATESSLLYAVGGYSQAKISLDTEWGGDINGSVEEFGASSSDWESGWFIGAGVETMLMESITMKVEYRYTDYGKVENGANYEEFPGEDIGAKTGGGQESDVSVHSVRAVLSYRF